MGKKKILAIDDEKNVLDLIEHYMTEDGYEVVQTNKGRRALEIIKEENPDLVILDYRMPETDGIEVLKEIRSDKECGRIPVIMLAYVSDEYSKVTGLELGADDYLTKPFGVHELMARVKAVLRRSGRVDLLIENGEEEAEKIKIDRITIDRRTREVIVGDKVVELSMMEFNLLYFLAKNRGRVFSREILLSKTGAHEGSGKARSIDVHMRKLRQKIEEDDTNPVYLKTVRGVGYKFV